MVIGWHRGLHITSVLGRVRADAACFWASLLNVCVAAHILDHHRLTRGPLAKFVIFIPKGTNGVPTLAPLFPSLETCALQGTVTPDPPFSLFT